MKKNTSMLQGLGMSISGSLRKFLSGWRKTSKRPNTIKKWRRVRFPNPISKKKRRKYVDTPWGKSELMMTEDAEGNVDVVMTKERYKKLINKKGVKNASKTSTSSTRK